MSIPVYEKALSWIRGQGYEVTVNRVMSDTPIRKTIGYDVVCVNSGFKRTYSAGFISTAVENAVRDLVSVSTLYTALGIIKEGEGYGHRDNETSQASCRQSTPSVQRPTTGYV